jgi:hypothetical protein
MGVGGEHAAIVSALLDLPEPHKWPRQFSVLEKHLYGAVKKLKLELQMKGTNKEVMATLNDEDHPVEQTFLQRDVTYLRTELRHPLTWVGRCILLGANIAPRLGMHY